MAGCCGPHSTLAPYPLIKGRKWMSVACSIRLPSSSLASPARPPSRRLAPEIKHDGYRIMARRDANGRVQLLTRKGNDFSRRFPRVVVALTALPVRSCLIDGEAIVCNENGLAVFDLIR